MTDYDAVVVGSGPNGLAAALTVARAGCSVLIVEGEDRVGGGLRSDDLHGRGSTHDLCAAFFPFGVSSPFFDEAGLDAHGLRWVQPDVPLAHPLDDGRVAVLHRSIDDTAAGLGADRAAYRDRISALVELWSRAESDLLAPPVHLPSHPLAMAHFGLLGVQPARALLSRWFESDAARGLLAGSCAHSFLPLSAPFSASVGLALTATAHRVGWPVAEGGSQRVADALVGALTALGARIETGRRVAYVDELPPARVTFLDVDAAHLPHLLGSRLSRYRTRRYRRFRRGPAAFKIDYDLTDAIPWTARECASAGTVHVGGTLDEIAAAEAATVRGDMPERPFVLVGQQSLVDPTRVPAGGQTAWVYAHVPHGFAGDARPAIEAQIERFAPGFRDTVAASTARGPGRIEAENPNHIGGDISGGALDRGQVLRRPVLHPTPYLTGADGYYLCSASTPPGAGVHGLCGWYAARAALSRELR